MDLASLGPYKNDQGPMFPSTTVSSLLYGTQAMLVLNLLAFENKKYTADDHFHGKILTKKEPIRMLRFTYHIINQVYRPVCVLRIASDSSISAWMKEL